MRDGTEDFLSPVFVSQDGRQYRCKHLNREWRGSLPNFADLAKEIAEDTGKTLRKEPCEVFLGALKAGGIDVNGIAAHILSDSCLKHNALHEAILSMLLNSIKDLGFGQDYLIRVVQSLQGLDEKENKQLQEALIKHGITLSLS